MNRERVEKEYRELFREYKLGLTIWSPLEMGVLTGKYNAYTIPEGTRYDKHKEKFAYLPKRYFDKEGFLKKMADL